MKKLLLAGVAALAVLSAPASYAGEVWDFNDYKRCRAAVTFELHPKDDDWISVELSRLTLGPRGGPAPSALEEPDTARIIFYRKHLTKLEAAVSFLKKCRAWVWDRNRGKALYLTPKEMKELE
jgi:hypothetical protein